MQTVSLTRFVNCLFVVNVDLSVSSLYFPGGTDVVPGTAFDFHFVLHQTKVTDWEADVAVDWELH